MSSYQCPVISELIAEWWRLRRERQKEIDEAIAGAKEWLTAHMAGGHSYVETLDQPALNAISFVALPRKFVGH